VRSGAHVDPLTRHSPALRSTGRINHLTNLLSSDTDEPTCTLDREDDSHLGVCIPPRGMPICVDDRATNGVPFTFIY